MISLKRSVSEMERLQELNSTALKAYQAVIQSIYTHTVEVRADLVEPHRQRLRSIRRSLQPAPNRETLEGSSSLVDRELAAYSASASAAIRERDREVRDILAILGEAAQTLTRRNDVYGKRFQGFARELESAAGIEDLGELRRRLTRQLIEWKRFIAEFESESLSSIERLQDQLRTFQQRLTDVERLAAVDGLTGVLNRREGERRIKDMIREKAVFCLLVFDIDSFKSINDRYGHQAGDHVLKTFARRLSDGVRPDDPVCRWGGDEFLVIMRCSLPDAIRRSREVARLLSGDYSVPVAGRGDTRVSLGASVGLAEHRAGESFEDLFERADQILYRRKAGAVPV
ncbi:MAG: GGDEF domain-containing protein [Bryobacterales bacterium]|nr:GGDEF domain-containing protein [Bryobacterales bacterium]